MLYLIYTQRDHRRPVLLALHLLVLHLRPAAGAGQHHQHLPRDRGVAQELPGHPATCRRSRGRANPVPLPELRRLAFEHVSFQHQSASSPALTDISFEVRARRDHRLRRAVGRRQDDAGQAAGRALPAAGGRHSLQRPLRPRRSTSNQLRERIGFVTQDTQLFSGTIRENLLFVQPDARPTPSASTCCARRPATACWRAPTAGSTR